MEIEPKEIIKEKVITHDEKSDRASKSLAGTALGFGIGGTALGLGGLMTSIFKRGGWGDGCGCQGVAVANAGLFGKECNDVLELTNKMFGLAIGGLTKAAAAREIDTAEKFSIYKSQVDGDFGNYKVSRDLYDVQNDKLNDAAFRLYKGQRDRYDELNEKFNAKMNALELEVAKMQAVRPYQDRLIQCDIEKAHCHAINYVDRLDCRNIKGVVTLPSTPTITGFQSYRCPCSGQATAAAGA